MTAQQSTKYTVDKRAMGKIRMAAVADKLTVSEMLVDELVDHYLNTRGTLPDGVTLNDGSTPAPATPAPVEPAPKAAPAPKATPKAAPAPKAPASGNAIADAIQAAIGGALSEFTVPDNGLSEDQVIDLINTHATKSIVITSEAFKQPKNIGIQHECFEDVLTVLGCGENAFVVGPAGSGKTTIAREAAKSLGRPFYFTGAITQEHKLMGFIDAGGKYHETAFFKAFTEGGVFLFDEIDASYPQPVLAFNAALDNRICDFPHGQFEAHPDFVCIAAANTYGHGADREYVGRNQLDAATLDRFATIAMDYDEKLELAIAPSQQWTKYIQSVRAAARKLKVRHIVSPRASIKGAKLMANGMLESRAAEMVLWKGLDSGTVAKIKQELS